MTTNPRRSQSFATRAVHAGERADTPRFTPTATPIYPATAYLYDQMADLDDAIGGVTKDFHYSRHSNPTTYALEEALAALEGTEVALACGSGMAALHVAILNEVRAGSRIVAANDLYGATWALLVNVFPSLGVETTFIDMGDLELVRSTVERVRPQVVLLETISNPLLRVADLPAIVEIAHAARATVIVDNTFASPVLANPAKFGVDVVVHSTTKYLGGHGDVTGGAICTDADRALELRTLLKLTGAVPGPFESWLTLRGIKTLPLRVREQSANAAEIASWLATHPRVERVNYPGLADLGAAEAVFNDRSRGGMVSFEIRDAGKTEVFRFLEALELILPGTTLGDVWTLALYPPVATHRALDEDALAEAGIRPGLVRVSVGIEAAADLIADLDGALAAI